MGSSNIENKINKDQEPNFKNEKTNNKIPKDQKPNDQKRKFKGQERNS